MNYCSVYKSPLGDIYLKADDESLEYLDFKECEGFISDGKENEIIRDTKSWLDTYFRGEMPTFAIPLKLKGTTFTLKVWNKLLEIPYGKTMTYKDIANSLGMNKGFQAVGGAVGRNHILIIVPCHRVIGSDNSLTGFGGGIERKKRLLEIEGHIVSKYVEK